MLIIIDFLPEIIINCNKNYYQPFNIYLSNVYFYMKFLATHYITIVLLLALEVHYFLSRRYDIIPCLLISVNVSIGRIPKILNIIMFLLTKTIINNKIICPMLTTFLLPLCSANLKEKITD